MDLNALWPLSTTYALVLLRVMGLLAVALPFAAPWVPAATRALLALVLAFLLVPTAQVWAETNGWGFAAAAVSELVLGLAMGFMTLLIFLAVQGAGDLVDIDMGFGLAHVMDPQFGGRAPLMGSFMHILAVLAFLGFNGHHHILRALADSFQWIPPGQAAWGEATLVAVARQFGWVFVTALRLAIPVLAALLILHAVFGILARSMPQLHVLVVAMPAKVAIGLIAVSFSLPVLLYLLEGEWPSVVAGVTAFVRSLAP
ncbi:MAG TPA: flagellar biosynthetic protein FliR [Sphingobacteriaceae bacterium]|nr:flagellar biosynthetic protein FliR [Sphingobacteriaceae bacterium]